MTCHDHLNVYYGDLHNHCGISYGHGSIEDAFANAREQLDFCSVTGHALWPDIPTPNSPNDQHLVDYHLEGFARLRDVWSKVVELTQANNEDGAFVTFLGFEMHSCKDGDHTILYRDGEGDILDVIDAADLRAKLRELREIGVEGMAIPHHIGYKRGHRGINWDAYEEAFSPVVEMVSMHGCAESDESARPYWHSMGPADQGSTMTRGLQLGRVFGVIGSTDHHSAHPGSYGHGRLAVWAKKKSRAAIWEAINERRTVALTGDRIALRFAMDDNVMGSIIPPAERRRIDIRVNGGAGLDCVDVIKNGRLLKRFSERDVPRETDAIPKRFKICLEVGWGIRGDRREWEVDFGVSSGQIVAMEPRFRGAEVVSPDDEVDDTEGRHTARWRRRDERSASFQAVTWGHPNSLTPGTQSLCLEVETDPDANVFAVVNGKRESFPLATLIEGARTGYLEGIGAPAYRFHRAYPLHDYEWDLSFVDESISDGDVHYVRVRQKNDQWAWSSPIFNKIDAEGY